MNKILISISSRQETVFRGLSRSLDIPVSELVRRALDYYIDYYYDGTTCGYTCPGSGHYTVYSHEKDGTNGSR